MAVIRAFFAGHPYRIAAAAAAAVLGLALFWYLASPLWIRTYAEESLPTREPARSAPAAAGTTAPASATPAEPRVLARGQLGYVDDLHNGKGEVRLVEVGGLRLVRFEQVAITNAPDIHVYLSKDRGGRYVPANTLYLGTLRATNGSFNYELPPGTSLDDYQSVVVWCRAFAVLITWADLAR
ncbi:MAG TPA: DM13 domain-containing protein [Candidatus Limnocylindria bacterium]|nr:DM13 domain-containing protein [Candidatus Limnocylindria bacterium]